MPRLRRVDCSEPGLRRIRSGRGFRYLDESGAPLRDEATLERVRALVIPPAWKEVWICPDPLGHLQATGYDDAGRKQYLYHERWSERRAQQKFDHVLEFASRLPEIRREVERDLERRGFVRERILACGLRLLDLGLFRIGSEEYADEYGTFGVSTLRTRHVRFERGHAVFDYRAKGGQRLVQEIADPPTVQTLRALKRRRSGGYRLLMYRDGKRWCAVRAEQLNDYLKLLAGEDFTAKDFRTWNATVLAATALASRDDSAESKAARKRVEREVVEEVAAYLSNTPAVCRSSYIDPRVFDRFQAGETIRPTLARLAASAADGSFVRRERIEGAVLDLIG